jgi:TRAP-type mannitol/chloroaromatic compound transport system permease small subunit
MKTFLTFSRGIDSLNQWIGKLSLLMILASTAISAGNALVRYTFGWGSNALLEIQWYLFAAVFMLGAGYGFLRGVHVRIDFISHRFSPRGRNWLDVAGILIFLLPFCILMIDLGWPLAVNAYVSQETSFNPGGLLRWPIYAFIPVGFGLLALQAISELIKRLNFLFGNGPDVLSHDEPETSVEESASVAEEKS